MEHKNKTRIPAWLRPSTIRRMDGWLEEANCKSRSEFIEKSLHFYMGYLGAEDASEYLPDELTATLRGIVADSTNRTNSLLFKCAVEQGVMAHPIAAHFGEDLIQSVHPDDLLAQRAGDDVIGDGHSGLFSLMLNQIFDARCHSCGDDRCFLSLH